MQGTQKQITHKIYILQHKIVELKTSWAAWNGSLYIYPRSTFLLTYTLEPNLKLPYKLPFLTGKQYVECLRFLKGKKWSYLHILLVGLQKAADLICKGLALVCGLKKMQLFFFTAVFLDTLYSCGTRMNTWDF